MGPSCSTKIGIQNVPNHRALSLSLAHSPCQQGRGGRQEDNYQRSVEPHGGILEDLPPNEGREEDVERERQRQEHGHGDHLQQGSIRPSVLHRRKEGEMHKISPPGGQEQTWRGWYGSCHPCRLIASPLTTSTAERRQKKRLTERNPPSFLFSHQRAPPISARGRKVRPFQESRSRAAGRRPAHGFDLWAGTGGRRRGLGGRPEGRRGIKCGAAQIYGGWRGSEAKQIKQRGREQGRLVFFGRSREASSHRPWGRLWQWQGTLHAGPG